MYDWFRQDGSGGAGSPYGSFWVHACHNGREASFQDVSSILVHKSGVLVGSEHKLCRCCIVLTAVLKDKPKLLRPAEVSHLSEANGSQRVFTSHPCRSPGRSEVHPGTAFVRFHSRDHRTNDFGCPCLRLASLRRFLAQTCPEGLYTGPLGSRVGFGVGRTRRRF